MRENKNKDIVLILMKAGFFKNKRYLFLNGKIIEYDKLNLTRDIYLSNDKNSYIIFNFRPQQENICIFNGKILEINDLPFKGNLNILETVLKKSKMKESEFSFDSDGNWFITYENNKYKNGELI